MARIRSIKPEFFTDCDVADLPPLVRLLFIGLWCQADKAGRIKDKPKTLKVGCLPFDDIDIEGALDSLAKIGFIHRYMSEGVAVIQIRSWSEHQRPHHTERESVLPPFVNGSVTVKEPSSNGETTEHSLDAPSPRTRNHEPETRNQAAKKRFKKPTVEEVAEYIPDIDAQEFHDHYEANGWKVGRNAMKCWKSAARNWKKRQPEFKRGGMLPPPPVKKTNAEYIAEAFQKAKELDE